MSKSVEYRCEVITRKGRHYALQDGKLVGIDSKRYLSRGYASAKWEYLQVIERQDERFCQVMVIKIKLVNGLVERASVVDRYAFDGCQ